MSTRILPAHLIDIGTEVPPADAKGQPVAYPAPSKLLPHAEDWALTGPILEFDGKRLTACFAIPITPSWARGHFPGNPIMPGVLLGEMVAQAAGCHAKLAKLTTKPVGMLREITVKPRQPVFPGSVLVTEVELQKFRNEVGKYTGTVTCFNQVVAYVSVTIGMIDELPKPISS